MDRPVAARVKSTHLVCRSGWALVLAFVSVYFAYRTYAFNAMGDYGWRHDWWDVLTWVVWAVLAAGLLSEVRCWRERLLFTTLSAQFLIGCVFSVWTSARVDLVREARQASLILWCLTGLLSVIALVSRRKSDLPAS